MATASGSSVRADLETLFGAAVGTAFAAFPDVAAAPAMIAACNNSTNGDYQCNNAMPLFGRLKGREGAPKAPRDVATALLAALPPNGVVASSSIAGPGFINLRVGGEYLAQRVNNMLEHGMGVWAPPLPVRRGGGRGGAPSNEGRAARSQRLLAPGAERARACAREHQG